MTASKVIFATDFSSANENLLRHAITLARDTESLLLVVHVQNPRRTETDESQTDQQAELRQNLESITASVPNLPCEHRLLEGDPATEIIKLAEDLDAGLIVMGSHGRTGLKRLLMGSVAEAVAREASCPVFTYRSPIAESKADSARAEHGEAPSPNSERTGDFGLLRAIELLRRAHDARASDVHLDPAGDETEVRFRIDGNLEHYCRFDFEMGRSLINQLKVLSNLTFTNPFQPKEGLVHLPEPLEDLDVRMTISRVSDGEAIALRLLNRSQLIRPMNSLGFREEAQNIVDRILRQDEGLLLVTGPTGVGKTTTLYSMLHTLDNGARNIVSIEDPIEYAIPSFRQIAVDERHGVTMAQCLRTSLRMDPDIVMVGEIRDSEAAKIAMRAASSGKHVFSSLHTRDVASTITALRDLQIDNRSLTGNLAGILSQRLVRRLCRNCTEKVEPTDEQIAAFQGEGLEPPRELYQPVGCDQCRQTGFFDRVGIFEVTTADKNVRNAIERGASEEELRKTLQAGGTASLLVDALEKVRAGITSFEEVMKMRWTGQLHQEAQDT